MKRPIVVIPSCTKLVDDRPFYGANGNYSLAISQVADCQPLLIPLEPNSLDLHTILDIADGILLSGSQSNISPEQYSQEPPIAPDQLDPARDRLTLPLIRLALEKNIPLMGICRGFQEINVALGGTLHQAVHNVEGFFDHREREDKSDTEQWDPVHNVKLSGKLQEWIGEEEIFVNSLHWQGIKDIAPRLIPEAFSTDGLIEAVRGPEDHPFCLGVQWHPEWKALQNPVSIKLFQKFGEAVKNSI
ncbi:MAG: gamma-glutamyl-gamma-aminobutyrate hydrolase family protein [Hyphomicrobium sp.]